MSQNSSRTRAVSSPSLQEEVGAGVGPADGQQWQNYVLSRLQEKLPPEPIKVACLRPPENRRLDIEEYHGRISKDELIRLLDGKSGRYLVRDSTTSGSYTLSFNFDGDIKHQSLILTNNGYKTDMADSSEYKTVHELMVYVLGLGERMKKMEGSRKKPYHKQHEFENHTYVHPKWCGICGGFIWGLWSQGLKCEDCGIGIHKHCRSSATDACEKVVLGQKLSTAQSPTVDKEKRKRVSLPDPREVSKSKLPQRSPNDKLPCNYEKECFKFLNSQVPLNYFDKLSPLNICYCDDHQNTGETKFLQNWCKFALVRSPRELVRKLKPAYFSVFPGKIKETLDALSSGSFYQRLKSDELVVLPSMENILLMESHETENNLVCTVLEVGVEPGSYTSKSAVNDVVKGVSKPSRLEYWAISPGNQVFSIALLIELKKT